MGFFDKLFGGGSDSKQSELVKGWKSYEDAGGAFLFLYPPDWSIGETDHGIELCPPGAPRVTDPLLKGEAADPRVVAQSRGLAGPDQNLIKDHIRSMTGKYEGYKFIKHHSNSVPGAVQGVIFEFQYGPKEQLFNALSVLARSKSRLVEMTASGTVQSFDRNRSLIEGMVFSLRISASA